MRERLLANWPLKGLALVIAFGIWVAITGQDRTVRDLNVPLEVDFGSERYPGAQPPKAVAVRVEGPRSAIRKLDPLRVAVRVDMSNSPLGEHEVLLARSHLTGVTKGLEVSRFDPDRVRLVVAPRAERELPIVPYLVGTLPDGLALYGVDTRPATAVIEGPENAVAGLRRVHTATIPLEGRIASFVTTVGVDAGSPGVRVVDLDGVEVEVHVDEAPVRAVFEKLTVAWGPGLAGSRRWRPPLVDVTLSGPPGVLDRLEPAQLAAFADGADADGLATVRVDLRLGEEERRLVRVESIEPPQVRGPKS